MKTHSGPKTPVMPPSCQRIPLPHGRSRPCLCQISCHCRKSDAIGAAQNCSGLSEKSVKTASPPRIAGRCGLQRQPRGATAFTCTVFFPRLPLVPAVRRSPGSCRTPGSQAATGRFRGREGRGCHPDGKARTNGLTGADSGEQSGRASRSPRIPLTSPFSVHIFALLLPPLPAAVYCSPSAIVRSAAGSNPPSSAAGPLSPRR